MTSEEFRHRGPGDRPRSRFLMATTGAIAFLAACTRNQHHGLPFFKRPQLHIVYVSASLAGCALFDKMVLYKFLYDRKKMLFDTQSEYPTYLYGTVSEIPKPLPDSFKELDPHKPYWYPYNVEGEAREKYFHKTGGKDLWEGNMDFMKPKP
ncbi:uncharacterized protein LOC135817558 [Sycon ciliatum]|uniref:uncharacterized protein LOC135817558 n=1 Tax=Sycon ciliatum TaxID=27933 RepID=UPI0020A8FC54|eukprot:scpid78479/ scgid31722/ 